VERIAIDLGSRESQICVRNDKGEIVEERRHATASLARYLAKRPPGARVLLESSSEAFAVAQWASECGHTPQVVPSSLVRALGVGERGLKTDVRDARKLSEMDCRMAVPSVHIPSCTSRDHQARLTARQALVDARTQLVNVVRSYYRTLARPSFRATPKTLCKQVRTALVNDPDGLPDYIENLLCAIDTLNEQIAAADEALEQLTSQDPVCKLLQTMPGIGPVTSLWFKTAVDEVSRFEDASRLTSYLGLTPGEDTTGFKTKRTGITKAGSPRVRATLTQSAWCIVRHRPDDPLVRWFQTIAGRRGKKIAIVAMCRKIAGILFAMWRDQKRYDASKAARPMTA
jgi:transposase